jgi:hypothetical protein
MRRRIRRIPNEYGDSPYWSTVSISETIWVEKRVSDADDADVVAWR